MTRFLDLIKFHKLPLAIIFLSCIALYANTIQHDYTLDDQLAIYENKFVTQGISGIPDILTNDAFVGFFGERGSRLIAGGRYRPLSFISFAIEWQLFEKNPMVGHILNIVFYGLLCCGIFLFLSFLFQNQKETIGKYDFIFSLPFLTTILYVFHPIHTEVVANIKGRDELYGFLFSILALIYFFQFYSDTLRSKIILFILFFFALLSKENSITFLAIFPLVAFIKNIKFKSSEFTKPYIIIALATIVYLVLRSSFTYSKVIDKSGEILNNPFLLANFEQEWATILYSFGRYFKLLMMPTVLTHDYYFNQIPYQIFSNIAVILSAILLVLVVFIIFKTYQSRNSIFFGLLFFILTFSIVSNVFFTVGIIMNERFVFISSLGFCILAAHIFKYAHSKSMGHILLAIVLVLFSYKTFTRNMDWKTNETLFAKDYTQSNNSAKVSTAYGGTLMEKYNAEKDSILRRIWLDSSIHVIEHSLNIYPQNSQTWLLYGNALYAKHSNRDEAIKIYHTSLYYRNAGFFDAYYNLGVLYFNGNQYDSAEYYLKKANEMQPDHKSCQDALSRVFAKNGNTKAALELTGFDMNNLSELALNAKDGGNFQEAFNLAEQALFSNPKDPKALYVKGVCLARHFNKINEGIPYLEQATALEKNGYWLEDLAVCYGMTGQIGKTIPILEDVIKMRPNEPAGYQNLATTYAKMGNLKKAEELMKMAQTKAAMK